MVNYYLVRQGQYGTFYIARSPNTQRAAGLVKLVGECIEETNFILSSETLEGIVDIFKTGNSVGYWERKLSVNDITEVQKYHII